MHHPSILSLPSAAAATEVSLQSELTRLAGSANPEVARLATCVLMLVAKNAADVSGLGKARLTYKEFAKRVGRSLRTVKGWAGRKIITVEKIGGVVMIDWATADAELKARGIKSKATGVAANMQRRAA